jgi:hypothetical protein
MDKKTGYFYNYSKEIRIGDIQFYCEDKGENTYHYANGIYEIIEKDSVFYHKCLYLTIDDGYSFIEAIDDDIVALMYVDKNDISFIYNKFDSPDYILDTDDYLRRDIVLPENIYYLYTHIINNCVYTYNAHNGCVSGIELSDKIDDILSYRYDEIYRPYFSMKHIFVDEVTEELFQERLFELSVDKLL